MITTDFTHVYAIPGDLHIIDAIRPDGLTSVSGHTEAEVRAREPRAVRMTWETWRAQAAAAQAAPLIWEPTTADRYREMLEVLPPIDWDGGAFLVGEATDHDLATGRPRYQGYRCLGETYWASSRPITRAELRSAREATS